MSYKRIDIEHKESGQKWGNEGPTQEVDEWFNRRKAAGKYKPLKDFKITHTDLTQEYEQKDLEKQAKKQEAEDIKLLVDQYKIEADSIKEKTEVPKELRDWVEKTTKVITRLVEDSF